VEGWHGKRGGWGGIISKGKEKRKMGSKRLKRREKKGGEREKVGVWNTTGKVKRSKVEKKGESVSRSIGKNTIWVSQKQGGSNFRGSSQKHRKQCQKESYEKRFSKGAGENLSGGLD